MTRSRGRHRTLSLSLSLSLAVFTGCASTPDPNSRPATQERIIVSSDPAGTVADIDLVRPDYVGSFVVPASRARLWPMVAPVFAQLGLPAPSLDDGTWTAVVQNHTLTRRLGDARLSILLDCGSDMSGRLADSYRVRLSVRTWLEPAGGENTDVRTRVEATASPPDRAGTITCTSNGELEKRIAAALAARVES
jgi:hypothetical protein